MKHAFIFTFSFLFLTSIASAATITIGDAATVSDAWTITENSTVGFSATPANKTVTHSGTLSFADSGYTLAINTSAPDYVLKQSGEISGSGDFSVTGGGTFTITGVYNVTGSFTVSGGSTLNFTPSASVYNKVQQITINGGTVNIYPNSSNHQTCFNTANPFAFGAEGGTLNSPGNLHFGADGSITTTANAKDATISQSGEYASQGLNLNGATVTFNTAENSTLNVTAKLWNGGTIKKTGAGTLNLNGVIDGASLNLKQDDGTINIGSATAPNTNALQLKVLHVSELNSSSSGTLNYYGGETGTFKITDYSTVGNHGTGTLNIHSGAISYSQILHVANWGGSVGTINLNGGSLKCDGGIGLGTRGSGALNVSGGSFTTSTLTIGGGHDAASNGMLTITGGTVTASKIKYGLTNNNASRGTLNLRGGELILKGNVEKEAKSTSAMNLGQGKISVQENSSWNSGVSLKFDGRSATDSADNPNGSTTFNVTSGKTATIAGEITGTGGINVTGGGTLTLTGAYNATNSFTVSEGSTLNFTPSNSVYDQVQQITINGGTVNIYPGDNIHQTRFNTANPFAFGAEGGTLNSTGNLHFTNGSKVSITTTANAKDATISGSGGLNINSATVTFNTAENSTLNVTGKIWNGGTIVKSGTGTMKVSNTSNSEFRGSVTVNQGTLIASGTNSLGQANAGRKITVNAGGTLQFASTNVFNDFSSTDAIPEIIVNGGTLRNSATGEANRLGKITFTNGSTLDANTSNTTYKSIFLKGDVTVQRDGTKTTPVTFQSIAGDAGSAIAMNGITLTVANITGDANTTDLYVPALISNTYMAGSTVATSFTKAGAGIMELTAANTYTGKTTVSGGTLLVKNTTTTSAVDIASGASYVLDYASNVDVAVNQTYSGSGTLIKRGVGTLTWPGTSGKFQFGSGSEIRVEGGTFTGGSNRNEDWSQNKSDLYVAKGATFNGVEASVRVDALNGEGTIKTGYNDPVYKCFTFGVDGGSGEFSGVISNRNAAGVLVKEGSGTQIFSGKNTYTGGTTIKGGVIKLVGEGTLGTGTVTLAGGTLDISEKTDKLNVPGMQMTNLSSLKLELNKENGQWSATSPLELTSTTLGGTLEVTLTGEAVTIEDIGLLTKFLDSKSQIKGDFSAVTFMGNELPASTFLYYTPSADGLQGLINLGVPEPATWVLLLLGAIGLFIRKRN